MSHLRRIVKRKVQLIVAEQGVRRYLWGIVHWRCESFAGAGRQHNWANEGENILSQLNN
jgi:hypothetical protein